jgi:hypothetical protein
VRNPQSSTGADTGQRNDDGANAAHDEADTGDRHCDSDDEQRDATAPPRSQLRLRSIEPLHEGGILRSKLRFDLTELPSFGLTKHGRPPFLPIVCSASWTTHPLDRPRSAFLTHQQIG